tara:strand:+ start:60 stop:428 length:369 start_codon:yes stop_codon:yes gene_type:complete
MTKTQKTWTRDEINALLRKSDRAVERAIIRLFELQTADEQRDTDTKYHNTVGFSSADAFPGTRFARWLMGMNDRNERCFAPKSLSHHRAAKVFRRYGDPMARARRIAIKHSRQLVLIANGEM